MLPRRLRLIVLQSSIQIRLRALSWWSLGLLLVQPAIFSGVGFVLARMAGRPAPDLVYTIIGGGVMGMWSSLVFTSFYDITRDRREGTLEIIVGSPTSLQHILAIRNLANVFFGFISLLGSFLVAQAWFHYSIPAYRLPAILISTLILMFAFWTVGMFLANFHAWSRVSGTSINYLEIPVAVICGFMFPVSVLPFWLQAPSYIIPLRWAVSALNLTISGSPSITQALIAWLPALFSAGIYWLISVWMARVVHDRIRIVGSMAAL